MGIFNYNLIFVTNASLVAHNPNLRDTMVTKSEESDDLIYVIFYISNLHYYWQMHTVILVLLLVFFAATGHADPFVSEEPCDFDTDNIPRIAVISAMLLYSMLFVTDLCDLYFVPSINVIIERLKLSEDLAGATFVAIGSSAPEVFVALAALFTGHSDSAVGAVVGSCVFNVGIGLGATCLFTKALKISWKSLTRDTIFYLLSSLLMLFVFADHKITAKESSFLLGSYVFYVLFVASSKSVSNWVVNCFKSSSSTKMFPSDFGYVNVDEDDIEALEHRLEKQAHHGGDSARRKLSYFPKGFFKRIVLTITLPHRFVLKITLPDCSSPKKERYFLITFLLSIVWLGVLEYVIVNWVNELTCLVGSTADVMGILLLAPMTSAPEAIASIIMGMKGMSDAVIGNVFGSNVFDILLGLGVPFFVQTVFLKEDVVIDEPGLFISSYIALASGVISFILLAIGGFKLRKSIGVLFILAYVAYFVYNITGIDWFLDWISQYLSF
ncbi:hypothetical protein P9112_012028 [Eukaryota sp. TZLM1-RC]